VNKFGQVSETKVSNNIRIYLPRIFRVSDAPLRCVFDSAAIPILRCVSEENAPSYTATSEKLTPLVNRFYTRHAGCYLSGNAVEDHSQLAKKRRVKASPEVKFNQGVRRQKPVGRTLRTSPVPLSNTTMYTESLRFYNEPAYFYHNLSLNHLHMQSELETHL